MYKEEIILAKIASIMGKNGFTKTSNSEFKERLRCAGLGEYFQTYQDYLIPYWYNQTRSGTYENNCREYNVFLGLDNIFADLYRKNDNANIINLLRELAQSINIEYVQDELADELQELIRLYELLGLKIDIAKDKINISVLTSNNSTRINEVFSLETWLQDSHPAVYNAYEAAINSYKSGYSGATIESCRTCLVSIFSEFKGTENFAKWMRGAFLISGEYNNETVENFSKALTKDLKSNDLAEFFEENKHGKLTKTKTIYMIYSMMSDYGTHRNESNVENPTMEDSLFSLRLLESILFWIFSKNKQS